MDHRAKQQNIRNLFGADYPKFDLVMPIPDGTPWSPDGFTDTYLAYSRRIGAKGVRFHDLRHTHASDLLRRGVPLRTVSQLLGHSNPTVTLNTYVHVMSGDDERAADVTEVLVQRQLAKKGENKPQLAAYTGVLVYQCNDLRPPYIVKDKPDSDIGRSSDTQR